MKYTHRTKFTLIFLLSFFLGTGNLNSEEVKKLKIKSINFEGNQVFTNSRLNRLMISRPSSFLKKSYYYLEALNEDLKNIELFYRQNGYLEAQIISYAVKVDSNKNEASIEIKVSEGELTRVEGVGILGNKVFPDSTLRQKTDIMPGDPFLSKKVEEANLSLLTFFAENGYIDANMKSDIRVNTETHRVLIDFNVDEKIQFEIDKIAFNGLQKTRPKVLMRELNFKSGDVVNYSRLLESQRKIYLTGLFQSVFIRPQPASSGDSTKKDILIELKENMSGEFNVALGFGSVEKIRGRMEIFNSNLRGSARKIGLATKLSFIQRSVETSFTEPRMFGTNWQTDINLLRSYNEEPGFTINRVGGNVSLGRKILSRSNMTLIYRHENVKISDIQVSEIPEDVKTNTRSLKFSVIYDTRDNLFNPNKGIYFEWSNESGIFFANVNNIFLRSTGRIKYFYPISNSTVICTALELGLIDAEGGLQGIPLHERFYTGGPNSIRGFEYEKLGPLDENRLPIGGRLKLVCNLIEIRQSIYKMFGGVIFSDIGNIWLKPEDFHLGDIRPVAGLGLRVNTPIGLARLDYGINLNKQKDEPGGKLYFSIGQAF